jgi:hypothetical protein
MSGITRRIPAVIQLLTFWIACAPRPLGSFRVLPGRPNYRLRAPDASETPFPEVPARFAASTPNWVELRAGMGLRVENAYYRDGSAKHDLAHYLGTQVARFRIARGGTLRFLSFESNVKQRPADQPPARQLISDAQRRFRHHRFYYEILFKQKDQLRGAVLLGAPTADQLDQLAGRLRADAAGVCGGGSLNCTVFPSTAIVAVEIEIVVNNARRSVLWGSFLGNVAAHPRRLQLLRSYDGKLTPVELDPADPKALRLPLLPGDHLTWD